MKQQPSSPLAPPGPSRRPAYTATQGQYLAFIYYYTKLHRQPPAEGDMYLYFRTSPSAVHQMVVTLERNGFIERVPGQSRSIRLLLTRQQIPDLA
jgi:repressor LexA